MHRLKYCGELQAGSEPENPTVTESCSYGISRPWNLETSESLSQHVPCADSKPWTCLLQTNGTQSWGHYLKIKNTKSVRELVLPCDGVGVRTDKARS